MAESLFPLPDGEWTYNGVYSDLPVVTALCTVYYLGMYTVPYLGT